jgi:hypothetical protein
MRKYNFLDSLYLSFYSKPFYQDIAKNWKGLCFTYLLFILCILWIPETSRIHSELSEFLSAEAPKYVKQVPSITITQGKVSIKSRFPILLTCLTRIPLCNNRYLRTDNLWRKPALLLLTDSKLIIKTDRQKPAPLIWQKSKT